MKKVMSLLICVCLSFSLIGLPVSATGGVWSIDTKGNITGYTGTETVLTVPEAVSGITVTGIADSAFEKNTRIKEITLPDTCTYIGNSAFKNCSRLYKINASGVVSVKKDAFWRCRNLDYVNMPRLANLSQRSFMGCGELNNIPVENFTVITAYAFSGSELAATSFPNVTTVYNDAFSNCSRLTEISLPSLRDGELYERVFSGCDKLEKVYFPDDMISLGGSTFSDTNISDFSFLSNIENAYDFEFSNLHNAESIYLPNVKTADYHTFDRNPRLKEVILPSCTSVLENAFYYNPVLERVILSDELEYVGPAAFAKNPSLKKIVLNGLTNSYEDIFKDSNVECVEFNSIQTIASLPIVENSIVALPSAFDKCTEDTTGRNYRVYGTAGSRAENWAISNGHTFFEISQENSVISDVPAAYDTVSGESIRFEAVGLNSEYQWYGSSDRIINNADDVPVEGAHSNIFNPVNADEFPYYYCKMISSDYDKYGDLVNEVAIYSSLCETYSSDETEIDHDNKLVYTNYAENVNLTEMIYVEDSVSCDLVPSYVCDGNDYYGTGAVFNLYDEGTVVGSYTVIMKTDINGDGVVDVLDASGIEKEMNSGGAVSGNYYLAADSNRDDIVDIVDYQTAINMAMV